MAKERGCYKTLCLFVFILITIEMLTYRLLHNNFMETLRPQEVGYVCQTFDGRLGNHIWQYASIYAIAKKNNLTVILGQNDDLVQYFEVPSAQIRPNRDMCESFEKRFSKYCCTFEEDMLNISNNSSYILGKFLQSWRYFAGMFEDIRKELTFKKWLKINSIEIVEGIRQNYNDKLKSPNESVTVVGIHIRRGDIVSAHYNDVGVWPAPDEYIRHAIDFVLQKFLNIVFVVCSDDIEYAKIVTKYRNITTHYFHMRPIEDLALLAHTDHVIETLQSFGWWAGFLSGGMVVYYKDPFELDSPAGLEFNNYDYYPPEWIGLN